MYVNFHHGLCMFHSPQTDNYTDENTNILCVGKRDTAKDLCRAYLKFEGVESLLAGMYVEKANLELNFHHVRCGPENVCPPGNIRLGSPEDHI